MTVRLGAVFLLATALSSGACSDGIADARLRSEPSPLEVAKNLRKAGVVARPGDRAFRIPASSMEPTLHCARPAPGCRAAIADRILVRPYESTRRIERGDVIAFEAPKRAAFLCGSSGIFVKRIIGLPGETIHERAGFVFVDGHKLAEPYVRSRLPDLAGTKSFHLQVAGSRYFVLGDNRPASCDSRIWGTLRRANIIGRALAIYWPSPRARHL